MACRRFGGQLGPCRARAAFSAADRRACGGATGAAGAARQGDQEEESGAAGTARSGAPRGQSAGRSGRSAAARRNGTVRSGRAGDLIIWNDALPHGSRPNRGGAPRLVQYIRMYPTRMDVQEAWK